MTAAGVRHVAEIGAEFGGMTQRLAGFAAEQGGSLTGIASPVKPEFLNRLAQNQGVRHISKPSLQAIETLSDIDAWVIDGDHNYTVIMSFRRSMLLPERRQTAVCLPA